MTGAPPGAFGILGASLERSNATLFGLPVVIDVGPAPLLVNMPILYDATGSFAIAAPLRHPGLAGVLLRAQAFSVLPPFMASNGLEFRLVE